MKKFFLSIFIIFVISNVLFSQEYEDFENLGSDFETGAILSLENRVQLVMSNPDYMVTAGDIYNLSFVAGTSPVSYSIAIDSSYKIRVANLAIIDASGKTYLELKRQVEDIVIKNYPMSGVQFVLFSPTNFKVLVKGEVKRTVEREVWALSRLSSVVSGLLTSYSSNRRVTVTSIDGISKDYDLFKATRYGDLRENPYLRPGDVITVNRAERKISLSGSVERPGQYELLENENLKDLIEMYGQGITLQGDIDRIEILRIKNGDSNLDRRYYLGKDDFNKNFVLEDKDTVSVYSVKDLLPVFFVEGAVDEKANLDSDGTESTSLDSSNKISYRFESGKKYSYFVRQYRHIFVNNSDLDNAYIIRNNEVISIDLNKMLYDNSYESDLVIEPYDILRIPFKQFFVSVAGAVKNPGRYPYIPDRTYDYYIGLAGGFIKTENAYDAVSIIDINGKKLSKAEYITPESTITAKSNSFTYYFGIYAPIITTILSAISTTISVILLSSN